MSESKKTINQKSLEQVEQERLTRRAALRKLGFGAGLSAFMLLGVDDLARMVGTKMAQTARDSKTAEQIAKEFQSAGVALAASPSNPCVKDDAACNACEFHYAAEQGNAYQALQRCQLDALFFGYDPAVCQKDYDGSMVAYKWEDENCRACRCFDTIVIGPPVPIGGLM